MRPPAVRLPQLSLRSRLLAMTLVLVALGLAVSDTVVVGAVRVQLVDRLDQQLHRFGEPLARRAAGRLPENAVVRLPVGSAARLPSQYTVRFLDADGSAEQTLRQPVAEGDPGPRIPDLTGRSLTGLMGTAFDIPGEQGSGRWRALVLPVRDRVSGAPAAVLVASSLAEVDATAGKLRTGFLLIGGSVLLLIALAGWFAVGAGLRPLRRIEEDAALIAAGELSRRVPQPSPRTEVGRLSAALNGMLARIEAAFAARAESEARMRSFVADASHELRTPLASIRGFAELYRMGALPAEADVQRTMARIEREALRMGGLVEDLLTLARLDEQRPLELAPMDLRSLAADALHDIVALDPDRPVALTGPGGKGAPGAAVVLGDEARLRQVVANLVGNAVAHTPQGTPVRIGVGTADGGGVLEVADRGPGLTQDQAARVFERFYRVDASRSRQHGGGAGLGLAIVGALVAAHEGRVDLVTAPGDGALFRVLIPSA
ncbi:sensor histidine kinase [Peterkaempfera griseoplana]|uniref:sensor histidine kinase n=1 Tax=Peterkaempfera griseoplana TaxID=66896 RepID=UPI000B31C22C|nr:HAMP domain-containing sensor histidine kinase [Peterkaempfera griseoplana]